MDYKECCSTTGICNIIVTLYVFVVVLFVGGRESPHRSSHSRQTTLKELSWQLWVGVAIHIVLCLWLGKGSSYLISRRTVISCTGVVRKSHFLHSSKLPSFLHSLSFLLPWTAGCYLCWCGKISTATATPLWPRPSRKWSLHPLAIFRQSEIEGACSHTPIFDSNC